MRLLAVLLVALLPAHALAQTSEDAHNQHMGRVADLALNARYRQTMAAMASADRDRDAGLKDGSTKPDGQTTYRVALVAAQRAWLTYRDTHCLTVSLEYRGAAEEDEAYGKCVAEPDRRRTLELKALLAGMLH